MDDECAAPYNINSGSASSQSFFNCRQYDVDKVLHTTNVIYSHSPKESVHIVLAKDNGTGFNFSIQGSFIEINSSISSVKLKQNFLH